MKHFFELIEICESIANDNKNPVFVVDWACDLYDRMIDGNASVRTEDLMLLEAFGEDADHGLRMIDTALARRR